MRKQDYLSNTAVMFVVVVDLCKLSHHRMTCQRARSDLLHNLGE